MFLHNIRPPYVRIKDPPITVEICRIFSFISWSPNFSISEPFIQNECMVKSIIYGWRKNNVRLLLSLRDEKMMMIEGTIAQARVKTTS